MPKVLVPLAQGCEELEAVTIIDILRRADIDVVTAGLDREPVRASRGVVIVPDTTLDDAMGQNFDAIVMPGGLPGADTLKGDDRLQELLKKAAADGKLTAAVCAAPIVLERAGLLEGKTATSYPGFLDKMDLPKTRVTGGPLEIDGTVITSRGPGTAMDFALAVVEYLKGATTRNTVEEALVRP